MIRRDLNDHLIPTSPLWAGFSPLYQGAHNPIQPGLECIQAMSIQNFSGQPVLEPQHSLSKEFLPEIYLKISLILVSSHSPLSPHY